MLTKELAERVDEYLFQMYSPTAEDLMYLEAADNMILDFTVNGADTKRDSEAIQRMTDELLACMQNIFQDSCGVTPRLLQYQERYYELLAIYAKANHLDGMYLDVVALLSYVSSLDLYYLKELKYKGDKTDSSDNQKGGAATI